MTEEERLLDWTREHGEDLVRFATELAEIESPSGDPESLRAAMMPLGTELEALGFRVRILPGKDSGGQLYARPARRKKGLPAQLIVGHIDTVWPVGTLEGMPLEREGEVLRGPGTFDMKVGLAQAVFALRALASLDLEPALTPVVFVNSDEEIGSRESTRRLRWLARAAARAFVLEPSAGLQGAIKTGRKGIGRFTLTVHGRASHAGLDPEAGASAILELSHQVQQLFALNDPDRGVTVNVGTIEGGMRANVVAPKSSAVVDVRAPTHADAERVTAAIHALKPVTPGVRLEIEGAFGRPPMDPDDEAEALWEQAREAGARMGLELTSAKVGGASDGNTTSQFIPTLDGLGAVGDGAHAAHEHVLVDRVVERTALLAALLRAPPSRRSP